MTEAYVAGFRKTAESYGVNPDVLIKQALWPLLVGGAAAVGAGTYGLYRTLKDFKTWKPDTKVPIEKLRTDMQRIPGLRDVQNYGNKLRQRSENEWAKVR